MCQFLVKFHTQKNPNKKKRYLIFLEYDNVQRLIFKNSWYFTTTTFVLIKVGEINIALNNNFKKNEEFNIDISIVLKTRSQKTLKYMRSRLSFKS